MITYYSIDEWFKYSGRATRIIELLGQNQLMDRACAINLYKKIATCSISNHDMVVMTILTRGEALTYLASEIDIALFDPIWAEKKANELREQRYYYRIVLWISW
jgi:hypothetical protein